MTDMENRRELIDRLLLHSGDPARVIDPLYDFVFLLRGGKDRAETVLPLAL